MKKRKKKKLTVAQRLAFQAPIGKNSEAKVPPYRDRMGVRVNVG